VPAGVGIYPNSDESTSIHDGINYNSKPNEFTVNSINEFYSSDERRPAYRFVIWSSFIT